jgi:hypothetical protein
LVNERNLSAACQFRLKPMLRVPRISGASAADGMIQIGTETIWRMPPG